MFGRFYILRGDARRFEHDGLRDISVKCVWRTVVEIFQNLDTKETVFHDVSVLVNFHRVKDGTQFFFGFDIVGRIQKRPRIFDLFEFFELKIIAKGH
jgi:hypothetical protein